ncbi:MAG: prenyltransferase/squalene oxidase repeat-containing protein [Verrucomicrobiota bacterium]
MALNPEDFEDPAPDTSGQAYHEATVPAGKREGYWRKLGGGSLSISIIVHGIIILVAVLWLFPPALLVKEEVEFLPGGGGGGSGASEDKISQKRQRAVSQSMPRTRISSSAISPDAVSLPELNATLTPLASISPSTAMGGGTGGGQGGGRGTGTGTGIGAGIGSGFGPGFGAGFVDLPKLYSSRCSPAERLAKMTANGGSPQCEEAVTKGLVWLAGKQNADGSWGESHKAAMTGMVLLAFLGHCETPDSIKYGEKILKGVSYLIDLGRNQKQPQFAGIFSTKPTIASSTYEHGIATYALGETYSFAKLGSRELPGLRDAFEKGVSIIIEKQNNKGSWSYKEGIGYAINEGNDLSVAGWQFQALKAAKHTNLKIAGLSKAVSRVEDYLESTQTADGGFGNPARDQAYNQWNLSGAALLGLQTLGRSHPGPVNKGMRWLTGEVKKDPLDWNKNCFLYTWYYNTQATFQKGGDAWNLWNSQFQKQLLNNQLPDGSYKKETGMGIDAATTSAAGADADLYRTTLCTLMFEVYYRYLKVGDREDDSGSGLQPVRTTK